MDFTKKDLIYLIMFMIIIYISYNKKNVENMSNTDIKKIISEEYKIDVDAIRNLSKLANDLTLNNKLDVPGGLTLLNNSGLNVDGPVSFLPRGSIIAWNGKTPPKGWALCDGKNGTPDLRGRFIRMATLDLPKNGNNTWTYHKYTVAKKSGVDQNVDTNQRGVSHAYIQNHQFNEKGGTDWRTPHISEMPSHKHDVSVSIGKNGKHSHVLQLENRWYMRDGSDYGVMKPNTRLTNSRRTSTDGEHNHSASVTQHSKGNGYGYGTVPPYYVLVYIMKL